ncbi:MAG: aminotransferase class III-fold pyridoxal phosphate-dependent enzyme, partial [Eubacteriales bacterium]|nr:aminotransferase class III-fold pyridoxal phosphate-dependent enzyme [Eubacteriales bacterium]
EHNGTFRGNQPAIVAAKAGLELMLREHTEQRAKELGAKAKAYLEEELPKIDPRFKVRGIGLIMGIDFAEIDAKLAHDAILECFRNGLIVEGCGRKDSVLKIMPSLLVTEEDLKKGLDIILRSVKKVLS